MTSPIGGIFGVPSGIGAVTATAGTTDTQSTQAASGGDGFASVLAASFDQLQGAQKASDQLAVQAATGDLRDVHDYMIASTEASLATQLTVAVRNKAVEAFNDIMRMPI